MEVVEVAVSVSDAFDRLAGVVDALGEAIGIGTIRCIDPVNIYAQIVWGFR